MSRVSRCTAFVAVALAAVVSIAPVTASEAQDSRPLPATRQVETPWKAVAASGKVQARPVAAEQALWQPVTRGDELSPRTLIETGRRARATLSRHASMLVLDPSSRVELPGDGNGRMETSVVQTEGSVMYKVDRRSAPHFEVVTPFLVAGVKGTSFLVTVNEDYASVVVESGRVEVTNPGTGDSMMIGAGESILRQRDEMRMELVSDLRASRDVRRETKRLKRIRRANDETLGPLVGEAAGGGPQDGPLAEESPLAEGMTEGWVDGPVSRDLPGARGGTTLTEEIENVTSDLIQELIREEIGDGVIRLPDPGVVLIPTLPPVDKPTVPDDPGDIHDGSPDPIDINKLP